MNGTGRRPLIHPLIAGMLAGALLAGIVALMAMINLGYGAPWASTHTLTAQVADADGMSIGSDVRIAGRLVGQVTQVQAAGNHSNITFQVDAADWPLPADTTVTVRLATLLGQKYIQLNPGHSSQQLADRAVIGIHSTGQLVDFDQILNTFNKPTRDHITSLIRTLAAGVNGREGTVQTLVSNLADLSVNSQVPTQELVTRDPELNAILENLGITAVQLDASRNDLAGVIDNLNTLMATLASNEGRALKDFVTNTDAINLSTNAVLSSGAAQQLDSGLRNLPTFASDFNILLATLIPESRSFLKPLAKAEPSDIVNGNQGIPLRSAIDLIYEIGDATSQGYGIHNFGSATAPDLQGNFFLRQAQVAFDPCSFFPPFCKWGLTGKATAGDKPPGTTGSVSIAPNLGAPSPTSVPTPLPSPTATPVPSATPAPSPSPSATPTPSTSPSPSPSASPSAPPLPTASATPSASASDDIALADLALVDWESMALWSLR